DFLGADPNARPVGADKTEAVFSYFRGRPEQWKAGLPSYQGVTYRELWPGIDLHFTGEGRNLKYTLVVQPRADPTRIAPAYRGAEDARLTEDGGLDVTTPLGTIHETAPVTYQEVDGRRVEVPSAFTLQADPEIGAHVVGFEVGAYDPAFPLVIDPAVLIYS